MVTMRAAASAAPLLALAFVLHGCSDGTCIWNGDTMIKGCRWIWWFDWNRCIESCSGCTQDCNKLKCAASCARRSGDATCIANYETLCKNAVSKVKRVNTCDVTCSAAMPRAGGPNWWMLGAPLLMALLASSQEDSSGSSSGYIAPRRVSQASPPQRRSGHSSRFCVAAAVLVIAVSLTGCCSNPVPQLDWMPDTDKFNRLAKRVDESGSWQGTGFNFRGPPGYINEIKGQCHGSNHSHIGECDEWKYHEGNCHEKSFGMCECSKFSENKKFCTKWACSKLEADQFVCHYVHRCTTTSSSRRRGRRLSGLWSAGDDNYDSDEDDLEHTENVGDELADALASDLQIEPVDVNGSDMVSGPFVGPLPERRLDANFHNKFAPERKLKTECQYVKECIPAPMEMDEQTYMVFKDQKTKFVGMNTGERLFAFIVHNPSIWGWFQTSSLCIVPGDFEGAIEEQMASQLHYCRGQAFFREIEEVRTICRCEQGSFDASHCSRWTCTEHKAGLFGVLFEEPPANFLDLVDGIMEKEFDCEVDGDGPGGCQAWTGTHHSWKEADMSKCECNNVGCTSWNCDEYKVLVTHPWYWYPGFYITAWIILSFSCFVCCGASANVMRSDHQPLNLVMMVCPALIGLLFAWLAYWGLGNLGFVVVVLPPTFCCGGIGACSGIKGPEEDADNDQSPLSGGLMEDSSAGE